jgi:hypothetical protein
MRYVVRITHIEVFEVNRQISQFPLKEGMSRLPRCSPSQREVTGGSKTNSNGIPNDKQFHQR